MELPPLPQAPRHGTGSFSPASASRSAGVSLMLNPTEPEDKYQDRRRKIARTESSRSIPSLPPLATSSRPYHSSSDASPSAADLGTRPPRTILTPRLSGRSPSSLHRAVSLNQLPSTARTPQRTSSAVSPRTRSYAFDNRFAGAPALPTPPAAVREAYGFPAPVPAPSSHPTTRRGSLGGGHGVRLQSESTSPKSSYSGYSQAEQASPAHYGSSLMPALSAPYTATSSTSAPGLDSGTPIKSERHGHMGIPISSTGGQNVYQMMTLETSEGTVQLPVDVQAASRVADEKRRRNAGASARFRQRRKEKEKEASTAISRLEQQLKDLGEDVDFYKRERDYFIGVVLQLDRHSERHFPRPRSPRHRRTSSMGGSGGGGPSYTSAPEQGSHSPGEGRNVRRRTSTASINPPPHRQPTAVAPVPRSYEPQMYGQQPLQHAPVPGPLPSPGGGGVPLSALMHAPPQSHVWNPYSNQRQPSGDHSHGHGGR